MADGWNEKLEQELQKLEAERAATGGKGWSKDEDRGLAILKLKRDPSLLPSNRLSTFAAGSGVLGPIEDPAVAVDPSLPTPDPDPALPAPEPTPGALHEGVNTLPGGAVVSMTSDPTKMHTPEELQARAKIQAHQADLNAQPMQPVYADPSLASSGDNKTLNSNDLLGGARPPAEESIKDSITQGIMKDRDANAQLGANSPPMLDAKGNLSREAMANVGVGYATTSGDSRSVHKAIGINKEAKAAEEKALGVQKRVNVDLAAKAVEDNVKIGKAQDKMHDANAEFDKAAAARNQAVQKEVTAAQERWTQTQAELAAMKEDPDQFSKSRNGLQDIAAVAGGFFGAIAQGLSNGRLGNAADEMMNRAIERNINSQRMAYMRKQGTAQAQQSFYGMLMHKLGDTRMADHMLRGQMVGDAKEVIEQLREKLGTEKAGIVAEQANAKLDQEYAQRDQALWPQMVDQFTRTHQSSTKLEDLSKLFAAQRTVKPKMDLQHNISDRQFVTDYDKQAVVTSELSSALKNMMSLSQFDKKSMGWKMLQTDAARDAYNQAVPVLMKLAKANGSVGDMSAAEIANMLGAGNLEEAKVRAIEDPNRTVRGVSSLLRRHLRGIEEKFQTAAAGRDVSPYWALELKRRQPVDALLETIDATGAVKKKP